MQKDNNTPQVFCTIRFLFREMKKDLSERDICTKFITPAIKKAGWDDLSQIREEVSFTNGRIIVRASWSRAVKPSGPITSSTTNRTFPSP